MMGNSCTSIRWNALIAALACPSALCLQSLHWMIAGEVETICQTHASYVHAAKFTPEECAKHSTKCSGAGRLLLAMQREITAGLSVLASAKDR
jgi:hypothetical protein